MIVCVVRWEKYPVSNIYSTLTKHLFCSEAFQLIEKPTSNIRLGILTNSPVVCPFGNAWVSAEPGNQLKYETKSAATLSGTTFSIACCCKLTSLIRISQCGDVLGGFQATFRTDSQKIWIFQKVITDLLGFLPWKIFTNSKGFWESLTVKKNDPWLHNKQITLFWWTSKCSCPCSPRCQEIPVQHNQPQSSALASKTAATWMYARFHQLHLYVTGDTC